MTVVVLVVVALFYEFLSGQSIWARRLRNWRLLNRVRPVASLDNSCARHLSSSGGGNGPIPSGSLVLCFQFHRLSTSAIIWHLVYTGKFQGTRSAHRRLFQLPKEKRHVLNRKIWRSVSGLPIFTISSTDNDAKYLDRIMLTREIVLLEVICNFAACQSSDFNQ